MTEIRWREDWKPSELAPGSAWWVRYFDGESDIGIVEDSEIRMLGGRLIDDDLAALFLLGPPCRIEDAAEVERLRDALEEIKSLAVRSVMGVDGEDALRLADIDRVCDEALAPERQEAGDGE